MAGFQAGMYKKPKLTGSKSSLLVASFRLDTPRDKSTCTFSGFSAMSDNKMAVTDAYNKCLIIFSSNGTILMKAGIKKLRGPTGVRNNGKEWLVSDSGLDKQRVVIYDDAGLYLREFPTIGIEPSGIYANQSGNRIAITDLRSSSLCIYNVEGLLLAKIVPTLTVNDERFEEFTRYKKVSPTDYITPECCAFDANDNLYVTFASEASMVKVYNSEGKYLCEFGQWDTAGGIKVTARGNVLIADREHRQVDVWNTEGKLVRRAALCPANGLSLFPHHISILENNRVAMTVAHDMFTSPDTVQIFQL